MQSEPGAKPDAEGIKKRKVRKGTHSCWECKSVPRAPSSGACLDTT